MTDPRQAIARTVDVNGPTLFTYPNDREEYIHLAQQKINGANAIEHQGRAYPFVKVEGGFRVSPLRDGEDLKQIKLRL